MHPYMCVCVCVKPFLTVIVLSIVSNKLLSLLCLFFSTVQDNRYDNQRYTLKAGSVTDESNPDDVFDVSDMLYRLSG